MTAQDPQLPAPKIPNASKINPPKLEDYRIPVSPGYALPEDRYVMSAPELGGESAILAEFDAAARSDQFSMALQKLIRCRDNVLPALLERLDSDEVAISKKAAIALGYLRSPQAIAPLIAATKNPHRQIHWQAAAALSWIGSNEAISALIQLLRHPSIQVQAAVAKALGRASLPAVSPLVEALKHSDDMVKVHAAHSLGQISSPLAVTTLITALEHGSKSVRFEAAWALGQIKSPLSANSLASLLTDNDISVQSQAVQALKNIGVPAIAPVARMLNNHASHTRSVAARTLGQIGMEEVVPLLAQVLRDDEYAYVRCDAALALGEIGSHDAVFYLSQALKDRDRSVRSAILRALAQINSPEAQEVLHNLKHSVSIPNYSVSNIRDFGDESDFTTIQG
ncbi:MULTISPECIES: HEAT repeat domain-containing protein [Pseudanabaena]|uniref:PBS lyase HEAT domain protein repeat-containing protein n=2 Tax=Pseudanabaena TaxID=1152 RepID=L8N3F4_9CYAN|nr:MULTISPECIES: HEAT repeat domain-containing protein [Pseudanabaena]ELS33245.1 PBS lyase HEAT domain protein repeat-containing protein [Pseudanabaena biceps PCC 7429]MDG3494548.1 HEAT repeat domain-containing protein [Pseudanabaena catenata USMAC16]